jgi:osmotically inducible protein OsmC
MASIKRHASAAWHGSGKEGAGSLTTQSATLKDTPYGFNSRFGDAKGTNPEELIAAAHVGCFTMALTAQLTSDEHPPTIVETTAAVTLEITDDGPTVTKIHLTTRAEVPGIEVDKFNELAKKAKEGCPISRLFKAEITLDAQLV